MKTIGRRSRQLLFRSPVLWAVASSAGVCHAQGPNLQGLYVPPASRFIHGPDEAKVALRFADVAIDEIQGRLDEARSAHPDAPIVLTLTGSYRVSTTPLTLPSRTSLVLYGSLSAAADASASSLIAILGQSQVAVSGGLLDGRGAGLAGILAEGSRKINIDAVTVMNTGRDGIVLNGQGNAVWNSGSAITRCEVSQAGGNGITIGSTTQALVLDTLVRGNRGAGIRLGAAHSSIVNNVSRDNEVGIVVDASDNLIADNELRGNRGGGLRLTSASAANAVLRNVMADNAVAGIDLDGSNNLVYANTLRNAAGGGPVVTDPPLPAVDLIDRSSANWVVGRGAPLQAPLSRYFYPPTIDNRHTDPIMNGRSRTELAVDSSVLPTIAAVQQLYDDARRQHPEDVIVLTLTGEFTLDGPPLLLHSRTAVLLDGVINVPAGHAVTEAIRAENPAEFIAISGGTIDLGGRPRTGIFFPSATMAYLDQVTVRRGGQRDVRSGGAMIHFQRGSGYNILRGNTVDTSGGRCIWTQNGGSRYVVLENHVTNCNQDGVDFDSSTTNSLAIANTSVDNRRYGVFIEQSDAMNKVYANTATTRGIPGVPGRAIGVYNNATSGSTRGVTNRNTVFCNASDVIADGLRVGSIATAAGGVAETAHTFLFNNVVRNSRGNGILFDAQFARSVDNYFSQNVLSDNRTELASRPANGAAPPDFFNPPPALDLALRRPATASSSAPGSSPDAAVDGLPYTRWVPGEEARSSLTIDLGGSVGLGGVTLKRTLRARALVRIELQASADGVAFVDVPGAAQTVSTTGTSTLGFAPVVARFLRVQVTPFVLLGGGGAPVGIDQVAVHPELPNTPMRLSVGAR